MKGNMKSKLIKISQLKNNTGQIEGVPKNPRILKDDKYKKLVKSIQEDPEMLELREVIAYDNDGELVVIAGNMRLKACKEAGLDEVPTKILPTDTHADKLKRYTIKDNNSFGEWSYDDLANEWDAEELDAWGLDTPDDWGEEEAEIEEDEAPEVSDEPPVSKLGEIYQLGRHRVMCGSATETTDVEKLMNGVKADMVFTDPPYGNAGAAHYGRGELGHRHILGDEDFTTTELALRNHLDIPQLFFLQWRTFKEAIEYLEDSGKGLKTVAVWDKKNSALGQGMAEQWEAILISGDVRYKKFGGNVFRVSREQKARVDSPHPHQKPIELLADLFKFFEADTYIDPFLGSGSTLIACEQTDRTCYGMELDPKYVDVIRKRYHKFVTGSEEGWEDATPAI